MDAVTHRYEFAAPLWRWDARKADTWTFVTVPPEVSDEILDVADGVSRGFGSVRVEVTVGATTWRTSLFPDSTAGAYVLPVKKAVRAAEDLHDGSTVRVAVRLVDVPATR